MCDTELLYSAYRKIKARRNSTQGEDQLLKTKIKGNDGQDCSSEISINNLRNDIKNQKNNRILTGMGEEIVLSFDGPANFFVLRSTKKKRTSSKLPPPPSGVGVGNAKGVHSVEENTEL